MDAFLTVSEKGLRYAALAAAAAGGLVMLVMLGIVSANIVMRPFGESVRGAVEISGYLCALAVGLCLPAAQTAGSHITAGVWVSSLPRPAQRLQKGLSGLICAFLLALAADELFSIAGYARDMGEYIEGFDISYGGMALGFSFGIALHSLIFIHSVLRAAFPGRGAAAKGASA